MINKSILNTIFLILLVIGFSANSFSSIPGRQVFIHCKSELSEELSFDSLKIWNGFNLLDSVLNGIPFRVVFPKKANKTRDWIWRARDHSCGNFSDSTKMLLKLNNIKMADTAFTPETDPHPDFSAPFAVALQSTGIVVDVYGNNPMFSFEFLGEKKQSGYLNNTASGRDWGNQHVNDVRRLIGGEIFVGPIFGAEASFASEETKNVEATQLMQQGIQNAEDCGTKVIFALDFDTWIANPQNIIKKLPKEAVFKLIGGYLTTNPDHPEGYKYYKQMVKSLVEMYPQIDQLSVWHRRPSETGSPGTIWMSFYYNTFPADWKEEYQQKLIKNPSIKDNQKARGTFAFEKLIAPLQKASNEVKPDLEITSGLWRFDYTPYADIFYPNDVPLLQLDWEVVFNTPESVEKIRNERISQL